MDLKEHELGVLKQRLQQTSHYQQKEEVNAITVDIGNFFKKLNTYLILNTFYGYLLISCF